MGGDNQQNTVSEYKPPDFTKPHWENYTNHAANLAYNMANNPGAYIYQGQRVQPLVQEQIDAIGGMRGLASPLFGNPQSEQANRNAVNTQLQHTLSGGGIQGPAQFNQFGGATNPALEAAITSMRNNATSNFKNSTAQQTDAAAVQAGAYGGSGHQKLIARNAKALEDSLGNTEAGMRNNQMGLAAQLEEGRLSKDWQAYENERQRQMAAMGFFPQLQNSNVGLLQSLLGGGELARGLGQQELDAAQQNFYQGVQAMMMPLDILGSALTRAGGGGGTTSSQIMGPGFSPAQGIMGAGLLGASMFGAG